LRSHCSSLTFWYQRRSELDQGLVPRSRFRYGLAVSPKFQSRGFVDEEDLLVRDLAFDDLEAREPYGASVFFLSIYKYPLNAHLWSYSKILGEVVKHPYIMSAFVRREYDLFDERDVIDDLD
jgi:hypothetical protein